MGGTFEKAPVIPVKGKENDCYIGWESIGQELQDSLQNKRRRIIAVETYQGVYHEEIRSHLADLLKPDTLIDTAQLFLPEEKIRGLTHPDVTDDRVFGYLTRLNMIDLLDRKKLKKAASLIESSEDSLIMIFGYGASLVHDDPGLLLYADMARWEIQQRMRRNQVDNIGIANREEHPELKYKRGFFVDWRICDRLKKETLHRWDYVLDSNRMQDPKLATGEAVREGLRQAARRPFSVVPFFDPGPWGGQWMKNQFGLDKKEDNYAWCFNCIPEENSLLLGFGDNTFEIPSINLVFYQGRELLGDPVHGLFGDEFPIRFDFLDTMGGGNLSLQVHPLTAYIQQQFGMHYTQDESYYMLEAADDASVFLGLKEGVDPAAMSEELLVSERTGVAFQADRFVENWPAKKHDHFLIPAGTVHCSGRNGMVLEISATPYIFTFKLYDWGRVNSDGKPRPINVAHGLKNIQWDRTTAWTRKNLLNRVTRIGEGDGWYEERTGLHEREFLETRRHWFSKPVPHDTAGVVNVLTLVEGKEVIVESPGLVFDPFIVHYAETFIVPASVGAYTIRPHGPSAGKKCATIKAFVRTGSSSLAP
jgi:mannose-6-phosphate isomerase class I